MGKPQPSSRPCLPCLILILFIHFSGKPPGQQSDEATSELAWMIIAKQKQMSFPVCVPIKESKIKSTAVPMAETKEPRNGAGADTAQKTPKKVFRATDQSSFGNYARHVHIHTLPHTPLEALIKGGGLFRGKDKVSLYLH